MAIKESNWMPCKTPPTEPGLYKRKHEGDVGWQFWTGKYWGLWSWHRPSGKNPTRSWKSLHQTGHWKGVID